MSSPYSFVSSFFSFRKQLIPFILLLSFLSTHFLFLIYWYWGIINCKSKRKLALKRTRRKERKKSRKVGNKKKIRTEGRLSLCIWYHIARYSYFYLICMTEWKFCSLGTTHTRYNILRVQLLKKKSFHRVIRLNVQRGIRNAHLLRILYNVLWPSTSSYKSAHWVNFISLPVVSIIIFFIRTIARSSHPLHRFRVYAKKSLEE